MPPFVGRTRELRALRRHLEEGRNVVLTGSFGSGRTTLVHELANALSRRRFVFCTSGASRRIIRRVVGDAPAVLVLDDLVRVTASQLRVFRELFQGHRYQLVAIVEQSMGSSELSRLRAALGAARLLRLGPVGPAMVERYFSYAATELRLGWHPGEIRGIARSTHGHPLTMRTTLEVVVATVARRPCPTERQAQSVRLHEKTQLHGDGVRRRPSGQPPG